MIEQPIPHVTRADVERVVRRDYSIPENGRVLAILDEYHSDGSDPSRVQLAVLKLAGGNIAALRREIEVAKKDYRDVLAYAEYPTCMRHVANTCDLPSEEKQRIFDEDWKQYQGWLWRPS